MRILRRCLPGVLIIAGHGLPGSVQQAGAVTAGHLLRVSRQVVPQMPAIGDLDRVRCPGPGTLGIRAGPVPADDGCAGMRLQPRLHGGGLPVRQHAHDITGAHVDQHGAVDMSLAQREVVDADRLRGRGAPGLREARDEPQQRRGVNRDAQAAGQPGPCPPGQLQPEPGQHRCQRHAPPAVPAGQSFFLRDERRPRARRAAAPEPADPQGNQHGPASGRPVGHDPPVTAVDLRR
jgi:hypothetical protein